MAKKNPRKTRATKRSGTKSTFYNRKVRKAIGQTQKRGAKARYYALQSQYRRRERHPIGEVTNPPKFKKLTKSTGWIGATAVKIVKRRGQPDQVLIRRPRRR